MIYDYVNTKPPMEEVCHGWLKDAAAKTHKYLERWRGKGGKWYYKYKSKTQEQLAKAKRAMNGYEADEVSDFRKGHATTSRQQKKKALKEWIDKGRQKAYKTRKSQIATGRKNAEIAYRNNPKIQYKVRSKQVKQGRKKAEAAYKTRIYEAGVRAKKAHDDRQTQINVARGNAKKAYAKKYLGIKKYEEIFGRETDPVIKTLMPTVDGKWVEKKKRKK